MDNNNPPRDVLRDGNLKASLWRNESDKGPFYSATLTRTYKDQDGELRDAHSFSGGELLRVSELARKAYDRTRQLRRDEREQQSDDGREAFTAKRNQRDSHDQSRGRDR